MDLLQAAHGIHAVANSNMVRAIKSVSVERGRDPADFVMMAFGGAGPIHAAGVARALGIRKILVPPAPGVFSAFGLLRAEIEHHTARTVLTPTRGADLSGVERVIAEMRNELLVRIREEGFSSEDVTLLGHADLRYRGQSSELTVPFPMERLTEQTLRDAEEAFETEFERTYGHRGDAKSFELVTVRLVMRVARAVEHGKEWIIEQVGEMAKQHRNVLFDPDTGPVATPVLLRAELTATPRRGPLLVQEYDTTVVVPPDCTASVDDHRNIVLELAQL